MKTFHKPKQTRSTSMASNQKKISAKTKDLSNIYKQTPTLYRVERLRQYTSGSREIIAAVLIQIR